MSDFPTQLSQQEVLNRSFDASTNSLRTGSGSSGSSTQVQGTVAAGATDSGNPVKIGGVYNATLPTLTDGQRGDLQLNNKGGIIIGGGTVASGSTDAHNPVKVGGRYNSSAPTLTDGQRGDAQLDVNANLKTREQYAPAYEDNTNSKAIVEHRYSYGRATADTQIKGSAGFIHTVSIAPLTATPTAGLLTIYDSSAESGTVIYAEWIFATDVGHTIELNVTTATGIYVGFDATLANVQVTVAYR